MVQRLFTLISQTLNGLWHDRSGHMATLVAACGLPLAVSTGVTFDYSRLHSAEDNLTAALASAATASFDVVQDGDATWDGAIRTWLSTHAEPGSVDQLSALSVRTQARGVEIVAVAEVPTRLLKVVGIETLTVTVDLFVEEPSPQGDLVAEMRRRP